MLYNSDGTPMTFEQRCNLCRARRNKLLALHIDQINAVRWAAMTEPQRTAWINYRQALLDVPEQPGWPDDIQWPERPNF